MEFYWEGIRHWFSIIWALRLSVNEFMDEGFRHYFPTRRQIGIFYELKITGLTPWWPKAMSNTLVCSYLSLVELLSNTLDKSILWILPHTLNSATIEVFIKSQSFTLKGLWWRNVFNSIQAKKPLYLPSSTR